jgi:hypothetical protein
MDMKKHTVLKFILALVVVLGALGLALSHNNWGKARYSATAKVGDDDTRTLREKARQARRFSDTEPPSVASRYLDLEQLATHSGAVLIGTAQKNVCRLSPDGRRSTIDYSVNIEYVLKGNNKAGSTITVSLPGGLVAFPDGSSAEIRTPWFKKMHEGATYLLFLNDAAGAGSYVTTGQAQGVWEIPTGTTTRTVKAHTGLMNDPMWKYQNMDVKTFLKEVRKATHKER